MTRATRLSACAPTDDKQSAITQNNKYRIWRIRKSRPSRGYLVICEKYNGRGPLPYPCAEASGRTEIDGPRLRSLATNPAGLSVGLSRHPEAGDKLRTLP